MVNKHFKWLLLKCDSDLYVTYTQVWYIIGIVSLSPTYFHSERIGLIRVTYALPVILYIYKEIAYHQ